jgi:predicted enzyme related to lactoylglutathione lyase
MMGTKPLRFGAVCLAPVLIAGAAVSHRAGTEGEQTQPETKGLVEHQPEETALNVQYLEIVTPAVEETCDALGEAHGVTFGPPVAELGNARTADLRGGGRIGVRAPMGPEAPVVRPYVLVDDIHAAVKVAEEAGAEILMPPTETPGLCTFAIYYLGTIEHGLWQDAAQPSDPAPTPRQP